MDKIDRKIVLPNGFKLNLEELVSPVVLDKLDEIVRWVNKYEELNGRIFRYELDK